MTFAGQVLGIIIVFALCWVLGYIVMPAANWLIHEVIDWAVTVHRSRMRIEDREYVNELHAWFCADEAGVWAHDNDIEMTF